MTNSSSKLNGPIVDSVSAIDQCSKTQMETSTEAPIYKKVDNPTNNDRVAKKGRVHAFDHITYWVGNSKQAASFYMSHLGFEPIAFKGLETGSRDVACHALKLNDIVIQFVCAVQPNNEVISDFLKKHGDAVKDVAFQVENIEDMLEHALSQGAELVHPLEIIQYDEDNNLDQGDNLKQSIHLQQLNVNGQTRKSLNPSILKKATIKAFGDVTHTLIERNYQYGYGKFQPGYEEPSFKVNYHELFCRVLN